MLALIDILVTVAVAALCLAVFVGLQTGAVMALGRWSVVTSAFPRGPIIGSASSAGGGGQRGGIGC
jgi:hypothetical protein